MAQLRGRISIDRIIFRKCSETIPDNTFCFNRNIFKYDSQSDQKPERVDRKGLLGPGDGNARWIRLKIEELIDGIVSWQTPRYLADILTKFRIVDTQRDGGHLLYNIILFPTQLCKNSCL